MSARPLSEPIALIGMACRLPGASDPEAFWQLLKAGQSALAPAPAGRFGPDIRPVGGFLEHIDCFDAAFFGITAQEADAMDPQQRLLLELSWQTFEDAGCQPSELAGQAVGVFIGLSNVDYPFTQLRGADQVNMYTITGTATSVSANRLSYFYDLRGPSLVVDTACSSSLTALHLACESLRRGECTQALVGGVNLLMSPLLQQGFAETMALSQQQRCAAFGAEADGIVRGEGAALVMLKPLQQALADHDRIYALIRGSAIGQDGLTNGLSAPSPAGQRTVLSRAYQAADVDPLEVSFIEAHGTGTPLGDPIEARALGAVIGPRPDRPACRLGSVKSNLGHLEPAAGIAGLIKAVLALHHRYLPATLHAQTPHPGIPFERLGLALQQTGSALRPEERFAGVSAFGFGGTNVHVVLEAWNQPEPDRLTAKPELFLIPLSARSPAALLRQRQSLASWLAQRPQTDLTDLGASLALRRESLSVRQAFVAPDAERLRLALLNAARPVQGKRTRPKLLFVFSGMGSQETGMGKALLGLKPFRDKLSALDEILLPWLGTSVFELLEQEMTDPETVQPLLFALQLALVAQWRAWGIVPDAVMGASMGEIASAVAAGILDEKTALTLLMQRIRLLKTRIGTGRLAVVGLSAETLISQLDSEPVWVAAINGPELCVVAGEPPALERLITAWREAGVFVRDVRGAVAPSHTPLMAPLGASLIQALGELRPETAQIPFWSTVEARQLQGPELTADYWWQNVRRPVRLYPALQALLSEHHNWVALEISPHPVLMGGLSGAFQDPESSTLSVLASLHREDTDSTGLLRSLGELWRLGFAVPWQDFYSRREPVSFPGYAFEPDSHWLRPSLLPELNHAQAYSPRALPGSAQAQPAGDGPLSRAELFALAPEQRQPELARHLQVIVARALRLELTALPTDQPLKNLGIGSLVGMELYQRLKKELNVALALSDVLKGPSLDELSQLILKALSPQPAESEGIPAGLARPERLPLSFTQQRFWFYSQLAPETLTYHIPGVLALRGELDVDRLRAALQALIERHEILRTIYVLDEHGQAWQQVLKPDHPKARLQLTIHRGLADDAGLIAAAADGFELEQRPPFRVVLFTQGAQHQLLIDLHHLVADGYSFKLLFDELARLYQGERLTQLAPQYVDFALWQRAQAESGEFRADLNYWRSELCDAPALLPLATDHPRPAQAASCGRRSRFLIQPESMAGLESQARELGVSLYTLLLGAYTVLLGRLSSSEDLVIGTPVLGRSEARWLEGIGPYLNMLPLRARPEADQTSQDFLLALQDTILAGFDHQDLPFEQLVEALQPQRELAWHPIYQHVFALHAPLEAENIGDLTVDLIDLDLGVSRFELALTLLPETQGYSGSIEYRSDLFEPETIQGLIDAYLCLLDQWTHSLNTQLKDLKLSTAPLQPSLSGPEPTLPSWTLPERLLFLAQSQPHHPALIDSEGSLSYGELISHSQKVSVWLQSHHIQSLAVCQPRSRTQIITWLGALLAGVCYIPLDPQQPLPRLQHLLTLSKAQALSADPTLALTPHLPQVPPLSSLLLREILPILPLRDSDTYLIFTSGSSGEPKGVSVGPASLLNLIAWHQSRYQLSPHDRVALLANPAFDAAGWELWPALAAGSTLCLPPADTHADPERLKHWFAEQAVTVSFVPTPLLERLQSPWPKTRLRALLTGGDRLSALPEDLPCPLHNHYGPTENTVVTSCCEISSESPVPPPIGEPLPGMQLYLLDEAGRMLPPGLPAELWIGGAGLARGYAGRPDLTALAFVETEVGRLYRSGDRVRLNAQGQLEFLGRSDGQLKLRGVRVESAEIEARLREILRVSEAVVQLDDQRLLAWIAPVPPGDSAQWRQQLSRELPELMIPAQIQALPVLPLTARGKLDRKALLIPDIQQTTAFIRRELTAPEQALADLWAELLPQAMLDPEADFFELGGHSLLALDLRAKVRERLGRELPLSELFRHRSLSRLAAYLDTEAPPAPWPELKPAPEQLHEPFALTEIQQAYWIGRQSGLELGQISAHAYVELDWPDGEATSLDPQRLQTALNQLIAHHPMLQAVIDSDGRQRVLSSLPEFKLVLHHHDNLSEAERNTALAATRERLSHEVRPADRWPLFGLEASRLAKGWRLHLSFDALMADASSLMLLGRQLETLYRQPDTEFAPLEISFRDVVLYERALTQGPRYARDKAYWLERLEHFPSAPELPLLPMPDGPPRFERRSGRLSPADWLKLKNKASGLGVTPSVLLLQAFGQVLSRWQDGRPLTLNLTTFSRLPVHAQMNQVIGDFTRLTLLEVIPVPSDFAAGCQALQSRLLADLDHGLYSGLELMRALRSLHGPVAARFPVVFTSMLGADSDRLPLADLGAELVYSRTQTPQVWLDHQVTEREGALVYDWDSPAGLFPEGFADALMAEYQALLGNLVSETEAAEATDSLAPETPAFEPGLVHAALVNLALSHPDAIAVMTPRANLSYGQLLARAFKLSQQIGELEPETLVAIWLQPGLEQAVAVLAVLLSGGAYLPLNPDWPPARLSALLERSRPVCALTTPDRHEQLASLSEVQVLTVISADTDLPEPAAVKARLARVSPRDLAYVIFTSGSTGEPKGVMIEHAAAWNTILDINQRLELSPEDRVLGLSDLNFDLSVWDLFGPLAVGGALVYPEPEQSREPAHWQALCQAHDVTIWNSVPALMAMLTTWASGNPDRALPGLRTVMLSGDWIPLELPGAIWERLNPEAQVLSLGGATEAAIWSIAYDIQPAPDLATTGWTSIPYGYSLTGQRVLVLDADLNPCPLWAAGDLYISGVGLARGYFNDPVQTAERFIIHTPSAERLYRTGDRGRLRPDGSIEFLGRQDLQVKVQGYRIELAEIEGALAVHPAVLQAVVMAPHPNHNRMQRYLAGCVQTADPSLSAEILQDWLAERLPAYMIPRSWLLLEQLPLTPTGKVDRQALLSRLEAEALSTRVESEPVSAQVNAADPSLEPWLSELTDLMQQELGLKDLKSDQDLMALGINSIDLVRLGNALSARYGRTPGMGELFGLRSPQALARWYAGSQTASVKVQPSFARALSETRLSLPLADTLPYEHWLSTRHFGPEPVSQAQLGKLLEGLSATAAGKRLYGSANSLYPLDLYLQLRDGGCLGLEGGTYRYDAQAHALQVIQAGDRWHVDLHLPPAQAMASQSCLSLYLVADLAKIAPSYGPDARDYCLLEAGAMAQLLRSQAHEAGLGLCAVGQVDQNALAPMLGLHAQQQILHTLVGGLPAEDIVVDESEDDWEEYLI